MVVSDPDLGVSDPELVVSGSFFLPCRKILVSLHRQFEGHGT